MCYGQEYFVSINPELDEMTSVITILNVTICKLAISATKTMFSTNITPTQITHQKKIDQ